jgi:hypothetical protein
MNTTTHTNTVTVTVNNTGDYHHLPEYADRPDLDGLTIRQALKALRDVQWGNLGGLTACDLSDGGELSVGLRSCDGNSWLMSSQEACRSWPAQGFDWRDPRSRDGSHRIYPVA